MNQTIETLLTRRSVRVYEQKQISNELLDTILLAGSYAPNSKGLQAWKITAVQDSSWLQKINDTIRNALLSLSEEETSNSYMMSLKEKAQEGKSELLYQAPTIILVSHLKDHSPALADSALAIGNMMNAGHALGIGSCWIHLLPRLAHTTQVKSFMADIGIPDTHTIYGTVVMGYAKGEIPKPQPRKDVITVIR